MKKMFEVLKSKDFYMHIFMCAIVAVIIATVLVHLSVGRPAPAIVGAFMGTVACGLGKEFGDSRAPGNKWSWTDVTADVIGAAIGAQMGWAALAIV